MLLVKGICFSRHFTYKHTALIRFMPGSRTTILKYIHYEKKTNRTIIELANLFGKRADVSKRCEQTFVQGCRGTGGKTCG